jgi:hypothetical protein
MSRQISVPPGFQPLPFTVAETMPPAPPRWLYFLEYDDCAGGFGAAAPSAQGQQDRRGLRHYLENSVSSEKKGSTSPPEAAEFLAPLDQLAKWSPQ